MAFILPAIDFTDILIKGDDSFGIYSVQIEVWDDFGAYIGPKTLWIVNTAEWDGFDEYESFPFPIPTPAPNNSHSRGMGIINHIIHFLL